MHAEYGEFTVILSPFKIFTLHSEDEVSSPRCLGRFYGEQAVTHAVCSNSPHQQGDQGKGKSQYNLALGDVAKVFRTGLHMLSTELPSGL